MEFKKYLPWIQGQADQNFHIKQAIILLYFNNITWLEWCGDSNMHRWKHKNWT